MISVSLPDEALALLAQLADRTGLSAEEFARQAILARMEDVEDYFIAEERLRSSDGQTVSLDEVLSKYDSKRSAAE